MKINCYINLAVALIVAAMVTTVSCKDDEDTALIEVSLDKDIVSLVIGMSDKLTAVVTPSTAGKDLVWTSNDPEIAIVTDGVIQTVSVGKTIISAKAGNSVAFCDIIVTAVYVDVEGVHMEKPEVEVGVGHTEKLKATIEPLEATEQRLRWSSSDESIVTIGEKTGEFTAHAVGEAVITVRTLEGDKTATCIVYVLPLIELFKPANNQTLGLKSGDVRSKIPFSWADIPNTNEYTLLMNFTSDFETPIYTSDVTENNFEIPAYDLNELIKDATSVSVPVYWTVKPKSEDIRAYTVTGTMHLLIDKHEYLQLATESASGLQTEKLAGAYQYSIVTMGEASVNTDVLTEQVHSDSIVISFMYESNRETSMKINFMEAGGATLGSVQKVVPQFTDWGEMRIVLDGGMPVGWGNVGDYLQLEFNEAGYEIELSGIHFTGINSNEYESEYLRIISANNQLDIIENIDYYFKFVVTGGDSNARTAGITKKLPTPATILSFEYKSNMELANNFQVFIGFGSGNPGLAESRSVKTGKIPASSEWKEYTVDLSNLRKDWNWGEVIGDYVRMDFGEAPSIGMEMEIRNIQFKFKN